MKTSTVLSRGSSALVAALALMGAGAGGAAPAGQGWHPESAQQEAAPQAKKNCAQLIEAARPTRDGALVEGVAGAARDWRGGGPGGSAHLRAVLGDGERADLDGMGGPCRLVDGEFYDNEYINYGDDVAELLELIGGLLALDGQALTPEEQALLELKRRALRLDTSEANRALLAYRAEGLDRAGASPWAERRGLQDDGGAGQRLNNISAVPEPSSYAMLLAGLPLLAARRFSAGRARPAVRR